MLYLDTRGEAPPVDFRQAFFAGTTPSGGLYVPERNPRIDLGAVRRMSRADLATYVMYDYMKGVISHEDLDQICHEVFTAANFGVSEITPIHWPEQNLGLLDLSRGPTLAFKDQAMMPVARLMNRMLEREGRRATVILATSGDTGGAAVEAFKGMKCLDVVVLFPKGRVSNVQQRMMTTSGASNIHPLQIAGVFDQCQAMVKAMFDDTGFSAKHSLVAANSINIARVIAQQNYWVDCAAQVLNRGDKEFDIGVPSGNFGDAQSASMTRQRGVPIRKIIVATNQNDVLHQTFQTGIYKAAKEVLPSSSPSMDIAVSSNLERFFFDHNGRDGAAVAELYEDFKKRGQFNVRHLMSQLGDRWDSGSASEAEVEATISAIYRQYERVIDPHTAVGVYVGRHSGKGMCRL